MILENKTILVTGASRGIGKATASYCLESGAHVIANVRNEDQLQELKSQFGPLITLLIYDVTDEAETQKAFKQIHASAGKLDGLVNNAGIMQDSAIALTKLTSLRQMLEVNTVSSYQHMQLASRMMSRNKAGAIVSLGSAVGESGAQGQSAYAASKSALNGMTKSLAQELGSLNIRVNMVSPGFIETDLTQHYAVEKKRAIVNDIALKRAGTALEVAQLIGFLLSDNAKYITGQNILIDGCFSL